MFYAANTPYSVIRIDNMYYMCHEAIWYVANAPSGPWTVSVSIPNVIYTIPPSCPVYNVTYVYVYDYTPEVVYIGYYPGYYGSYVYGGTVVYGTGYVYAGWYGSVYYARPATWGYSVHYNPYTGGWAVRVGYPAPGVWFGRRALWGIGRYARWDYRRDRYDDRRDRYEIQRGQYDDRRDRHDDRRDQYDDRRDRHDEQRDRKSERREDKPHTQEKKTGIDIKRQDNIFSDRNGNVYRKTEQEGWQQRDQSGWSKPDSSRSSAGWSDLNGDYEARERGSQRTYNYQQSGGASYSTGSGAGRSGGGRRGR
jgi:hypothetical protein